LSVPAAFARNNLEICRGQSVSDSYINRHFRLFVISFAKNQTAVSKVKHTADFHNIICSMLSVSVTGNVARDIIKIIVSVFDACFKACTFAIVIFQVNKMTAYTCQFVKIFRFGIKTVIDNNNMLSSKIL